MKTSNAYVLYDPLSLTLSVKAIGGGLMQMETVATGEWVHDPDRQLTPLLLQPELQVVDPDKTMADGDHTAELYDCRWYKGYDSSGEQIVSGDKEYVTGEHGELTVKANVAAGATVALTLTAAYTDPRTGNPYRLTETVELSSSRSEEVNLRLDTDFGQSMLLNALTELGEKKLSAQLWNGVNKIDDGLATYTWEVLNRETKEWRAVDREQDLWVKGGVGTRQLTVDLSEVDRELVRVTAVLKNYTEKSVTAICKMRRSYGQWSETAPQFKRGKYVKASTSVVEVETEIRTKTGAVDDAAEWFDIEHVVVGSDGKELTTGYGTTATVAAATVRGLGTRTPQFGVKVATRSALRPLTLYGRVLMVNGRAAVAQVPEL